QQGVAVGRRLGGEVRADYGATARSIVDHHRLAPPLGQLLAEHAWELVVERTWWEGNDDADRLAGVLGAGRAADCVQRNREAEHASPQHRNRHEPPHKSRGRSDHAGRAAGSIHHPHAVRAARSGWIATPRMPVTARPCAYLSPPTRKAGAYAMST